MWWAVILNWAQRNEESLTSVAALDGIASLVPRYYWHIRITSSSFEPIPGPSLLAYGRVAFYCEHLVNYWVEAVVCPMMRKITYGCRIISPEQITYVAALKEIASLVPRSQWQPRLSQSKINDSPHLTLPRLTNTRITVFNIQYPTRNVQFSRNQFPVTSYHLQVTSYQLPFTSYQLPFTSYQLPFTIYKLPVPSSQLPEKSVCPSWQAQFYFLC